MATSTSTIGDAVGAAYVVGDRRFKRLTLDDWATLEAELQVQINRQRDGWLTLLSKHGVTASEMPALIRDLYKPPTTAEVWRYVMTPAGTRSVLRIAAKGCGWEFTPDMEAEIGYPPELTTIACEVAGMNRRPTDTDDDRDSGGGIPLADTSTAETGPPNPLSSEGSTASSQDD